MKRREFLGGLGVLSLGVEVGCGTGRIATHAQKTGELSPSVWVSVKRDGRVAIEVEKVEFGQGVTTMYSTLVAEELDLPIDHVDAHYADSADEFRTFTGMQLTGGSASTREGFLPMRRAAATCREMLVGAAAEQWNVPRSECRTDGGFVIHGEKKLAYGDLTVKAASQPVPGSPRLKPRAEFKLIGKQNRRTDLRAKIDGTAKFGADVNVPGMVRAWVVHGPTFGANATRVQADRAKALPGVLDVVTFPGGVAVVAEKTWQAIAGAKALEIDWDKGILGGLDTEKLRAAVRAHGKGGDTVRDEGNAEKAIARAATKLEAVYEGPYLCHAPMEPQNCTVHVRGDKVEVWAPNQSPSIIQGALGRALDVAPADVLVHTTLAGGGFGRRSGADFAVQAAHIAKRIGRPVQMTWSRESDMTQGFYRPFMVAKLRGGVGADGKIAGIDSQSFGQSIIASFLPSAKGALPLPQGMQPLLVDALRGLVGNDVVTDPSSTEGIHDTAYELANFQVAMTPIRTSLPVMFWRSVGHSFNGFVMESFVDELARAAKADPFAFRRAHLPAGSRAMRVLDAVAAAWNAPKAPGVGRGIARHTSFESEVAEVVDIEIVNGRIKVRKVHVAVDCGIVVNPDIVKAQMEGAVIYGLSAALDQEITLKDGVVQQTNFDSFPAIRMFECPEITVTILPSDEKPTGVGEPGLPPIGPAVANAIFDLTGKRLRRMPLQKELDR